MIKNVMIVGGSKIAYYLAERLIRYMEAETGEDVRLQEILSVMESGKQKSSSDEDGFYEMLDLAVEKLVDCL